MPHDRSPRGSTSSVVWPIVSHPNLNAGVTFACSTGYVLGAPVNALVIPAVKHFGGKARATSSLPAGPGARARRTRNNTHVELRDSRPVVLLIIVCVPSSQATRRQLEGSNMPCEHFFPGKYPLCLVVRGLMTPSLVEMRAYCLSGQPMRCPLLRQYASTHSKVPLEAAATLLQTSDLLQSLKPEVRGPKSPPPPRAST